MIITGFEATFLIHTAASLKEKRMVVKSVIERCRHKFNVSVIESGDNDKWQISRVGFAVAALSASTADNLLERIIEYLYADDRIEITNIDKY